MNRLLIFLYGIVSYLLSFGTILYAIGFVIGQVVPKTIDSGGPVPLLQAVLVDLCLMALFAIQHSVMARQPFKRWLTRYVPASMERSTYVLFASFTLLLLYWQWRPIPAVIWQVDNPAIAMALTGVSLAGWLIMLTSTFLINHFELFGVQQVASNLVGGEVPAPRFRSPLFYKFVRHPIYLGLIIAFWAAPTMTAGHLLFAAATTGYILLGISLEERDLIALFGDDYRRYRDRVSMLLPWRRPTSADPNTARRSGSQHRSTRPNRPLLHPAASSISTRRNATMTVQAINPASFDLAAIKGRQQKAWSSGDYAIVGVTLQIVGETLCEAVDLRSGQRVLDVAAGNGNATLAAARRFAEVTSTDYVGSLLERGRERATADRLTVGVPRGRRRSAAVCGRELRRRAVDVRRDVYAEPAAGGGRNDPRVSSGRKDRPRKLDPGGFHRAVVQDHRQAFAAAVRRAVSGSVGHRAAPQQLVRQRRPASRRKAETSSSATSRRALGRDLPQLLRPGRQGVRGARCNGRRRARIRHRGFAGRNSTLPTTARWSFPANISRSSSPGMR